MAPADRFVLKVSDFTEDELAQAVWLNTVGSFGVGSAGYWWGRAGAALLRLAHYLQGRSHMLWLLLYSDDCWATAGGERADRDLAAPASAGRCGDAPRLAQAPRW